MKNLIPMFPFEITYTQDDFINPDDLDCWKHCYAIADHGFLIGIVFADCESDALDELFDTGRLDFCKVDEDDIDEEDISYLGNNNAPCNILMLDIFQLPKPRQILTWEE